MSGDTRRRLAHALALAAAYYVGARIGLVLRFPPATPSVLWPPNAILASALLLAPPNRWWSCLAAALPAHLLVQLPAGFPITLSLALFLTNSSEALMAAGLVRLWSDQPTRFDTLRRVAAFVAGAVILAPLLSSFLDAGVVTWLRGEGFWRVFWTRALSNPLTAVALIPAIVITVSRGGAWLRALSLRRCLEAAVLAAGLLAVGVAVAAEPSHWPGLVPALALLPLFLFAAVRFGANGVAYSVLFTALMLLWVGTHSRGPFAHLPPGDGVVALQVTLIVVAIPLLGLTALLEERRQAARRLEQRLRFEELLSGIAGAFVHTPSHEIDTAFAGSLEKTGRFFGLSRARLLRVGDGATLLPARAWSTAEAADAGSGPEPPPDAVSRLAQGGAFPLQDPAACLMPLAAGGRILGALLLTSTPDSQACSDDAQGRLRLVAALFASALLRVETEKAARRAELDAQRSRQELAHFLRVSTVGEMTASLAHELNQPLTAILANAQAAQRLLHEGHDATELRAILSDIVDEDKRAGEVIRRLRELLRKGEQERLPLNLNALVQEVAKLVSSDALIRRVLLKLELSPDPVVVSADRIQIQQVLLNLLLNAMEAMPPDAAAERTAVVSTRRLDATALVSVRDTGVGIAQGAGDEVFRPFYTTKPGGMGMGLKIARSIVEAHKGTLAGSNNPERGATFTFALPLGP